MFQYLLLIWINTFPFKAIAHDYNDWLFNLKSADKQGLSENFLIDNPPPDRLVVIYAWEASPHLVDDKPVGHMALQINNFYLSVWPEKDISQNSHRKASSFKLIDDVDEAKGQASILVLELSTEEYDQLEEEVVSILNQLEDEDSGFIFSLGKQQFIIPVMSNHQIKIPLNDLSQIPKSFDGPQLFSDLCRRETTKFILMITNTLKKMPLYMDPGEYTSIQVNGYAGGFLGAEFGSTLFPGVGTVIGGIVGGAAGFTYGCLKSPNFVRHVAVNKPHVLNYKYPETPEGLTISHSSDCLSNELNCVHSVLGCLCRVPSLNGLVSSIASNKSQKEEIFIRCRGSYNTLEVLNKLRDHKSCMEALTKDLSVSPVDDSSRDKISLIASCVLKKGKEFEINHESICQLLALIIKNIAKSDDQLQALNNSITDLKVNTGRLNLLFATPAILPGGILRILSWKLFEQNRDIYLYSSYERNFGKPVGNKIRLRNLYSEKYICPRDGKPEPWNEMVQYDFENHDNRCFWLISGGIDGSFVLLNAVNKKALDVRHANNNKGTPLILFHTHFGQSECFQFEPVKTENGQNYVRIISCLGERDKVLDIEGGSNQLGNGAKVHLWTKHEGDSQKWIIENVE